VLVESVRSPRHTDHKSTDEPEKGTQDGAHRHQDAANHYRNKPVLLTELPYLGIDPVGLKRNGTDGEKKAQDKSADSGQHKDPAHFLSSSNPAAHFPSGLSGASFMPSF